jgi:energy-coupling factor transporter ATP-binding protein EcfA2
MLPDLFRRLKPLYGKKIDLLWLEHQTADMDRRREIEALVTMLAAKRLGLAVGDEKLVLDAPPASVIGDGDFTIGNVSYPGLAPYPFCVKRNELLRHVFILGPTGTGKSTLLLNLLVQILAAGIPFMVFDFKRNYRTLLAAEQHDDLVVFTVGRDTAGLHLNALTPPAGVSFEEWAEALTDVISTSYLLLQGARNVLKEALLQAHGQHGSSATIAHAHALLTSALDATKAGSRRYGWLESSTRSLEELSKGSFGRALNTNGVRIEELLTRPVIFELQGFGDDQKRFFCLFFLQAILLLRKNASSPREQLQHVLVFDEGHNVFPRERLGEVSVPARLAREVREYGEAIIAATQQADVSESLIANSGFKLILRCDYPRDVQFASQLLQVKPEWLPKLALGTGVARLPVRFYSPFLFTFGVQPIKNVSIPDAVVHAQWARHVTAATHSPAAEPTAVTDRELALLRDVAEHPITTITGRYERLGWNYKTGNGIKDSTIAKGLARFDPVSTPTGQVKILSLTDPARDLLERAGITVQRLRHGGAEHEYWKFTIAEHLRSRGFTVTEEAPLGGGKTVDLLATREQHQIVIEVETGRSDIIANALKCAAFDGEVAFVFTDPSVKAAYAPQIHALLSAARVLSTSELSTLGR